MTDREQQKEQLKQLIRESRVAERWSKSRRTIQRWRASGKMPRHIRIGSTVFYLIDDIIAHEDALTSTGKED
ncbi:helix-turn-helix transcriptional regulator [Roseobacter ponti]|uniref:DNA-binding protein n=1 Tax=Roseobacter ponti TaxID=1891787 RepID=A0A858SSY2_9RHOB|nr:DNA-binding protein [Roseobacter ponti]QJF51097.1 DNA-binding protein [Roseobacter ponti]